MKEFKCPRCHKIMIENLEKHIESKRGSWEICPHCDFMFLWRNYI